MTFKTRVVNSSELMIRNVHTIEEKDGILIFYPPNNEQCVISVGGVIILRSDKPSIDIRCTEGGMTILI